MSKKWFWLLLIIPALIFWGCPKDDEEENNTPPVVEDNASGSVTSTTSGTIQTPAGARIVVPVGAVPQTESGQPGTMVFSIEKNNNILVTPPTGESVVSDVYQFGPEGFVFARPVEVAIPVPGDTDPGQVSIWRKNPTTGVAEFYGSEYDPATRTVKAQTYQLSPWFITNNNRVDDASACIRVSNTSLSTWLYVCIEEYTLDFPEQATWLPEGDGNGCLWAPIGTIGWAHEGNWYVPQGVYKLCLQRENEQQDRYEHIFVENVQATAPWHYNDPRCANVSSGDFFPADTGRCGCIPTPTTSVGTGDIQVTLTWYNQQSLDLDLWVMDPDSEWCYYGNGQAPGTTTSGGQLDRDNLCGNYVNGRPENIYWTQTPPNGQYVVAVDWFSSCGNELGNQSYNVRTVVGGTTRTFNMVIEPYANMQEVTRFTISGNTINFLPPRSDVDYSKLPRPSKTQN